MEGGGPPLCHGIQANGGRSGHNPKCVRSQKLAGPVESSIRRRTLSDITNTVRPGRNGGEGDQGNPKVIPLPGAKDCVEIMKENTTLLKHLTKKNEVMELNSSELQKLRLQLQKTNQQNRQLAQANSQMLMELRLAKDRIKELQHELACTTTVLRQRTLELEEKNKMSRQLPEETSRKDGQSKCAGVVIDASLAENKKNNDLEEKHAEETKCSTYVPNVIIPQEELQGTADRRKSLSRRYSKVRTESWDPTESRLKMENAKALSCSLPDEQPMNEDKRKSLRGRSGRLNSESSEPRKGTNLEDAKASACLLSTAPLHEEASIIVNLDSTEERKSEKSNEQMQKRSSLGRPPRRAADKVVSYKEMPLNAKMRRLD